MPTQQKIDELKAELSKVTKYKDKQLINRADWGVIGFEKAREDFELVFSITTDLTDLPLQYLTDNAIESITSCLPQVTAQLENIDIFDLNVGDAGSIRDGISRELNSAAEQLNAIASPHIPYLAYRRGDISSNIAALNSAVTQAEGRLDEAKATIEGKVEEIDGIISAARDAAASVGVATFTQEFNDEAADLKNRSVWWLAATGLFAVLTIGAAILFYRWPEVSLDAGAWENAQKRRQQGRDHRRTVYGHGLVRTNLPGTHAPSDDKPAQSAESQDIPSLCRCHRRRQNQRHCSHGRNPNSFRASAYGSRKRKRVRTGFRGQFRGDWALILRENRRGRRRFLITQQISAARLGMQGSASNTGRFQTCRSNIPEPPV